ncbi:copper chaperone PCu(A)C [Pseudoalteromonas luteoviolacea]|uniref:copper chaperone PCu(A)C n=1 Tax=Pseudoalteromonas luteoviolacea TaxID=43657 RepID=UPI001F3B77DE|nr:copper chaperone PCu(A)C [Pseudoalteromonas luteoviolacea]MCF6441090.1 copper chaperone PCu(A)C [Pseudoalteromonas luteoviolacea]
MRKAFAFVSLLSLSFFGVAHNHQHDGHDHHQHHTAQDSASLQVNKAKIRAFLPAAKSTAGYMTLHNSTAKPITIVSAKIEGLGRVEIHEHIHSNGMMKMQPVKALTVPAKGHVEFKPGGYHLMGFDPKVKLKVGETRKLTLYFSGGEKVESTIKVVSLKDEFSNESHHHHH